MGKDPQKVAQGRRNRRKGKRWERRIAKDFREIFGGDVRRGWQSRRGDDEADAEGVPMLWIEAKHGRGAASVRKALRQATEASQGKRWPVAICKDQRQAHWADRRLSVVFAVMWRDDFEQLLDRLSSPSHTVQPWNMKAISGKRPNAPAVFVAHAKACAATGSAPMVEITDDGERSFVMVTYGDLLDRLRAWFEALERFVAERVTTKEGMA